MICEKCRYCYEIDQSNESNGEGIIQYCKHGLGNAYVDGYCNYPFVFIPIVILYSKIRRFFILKNTKNILRSINYLSLLLTMKRWKNDNR